MSFCSDEKRLSLYINNERDRLTFLGSTESLYGVAKNSYIVTFFFKGGDENGLVLAASNGKNIEYEEGKFPQLIVINKIHGEVQAKGIVQPCLHELLLQEWRLIKGAFGVCGLQRARGTL